MKTKSWMCQSKPLVCVCMLVWEHRVVTEGNCVSVLPHLRKGCTPSNQMHITYTSKHNLQPKFFGVIYFYP